MKGAFNASVGTSAITRACHLVDSHPAFHARKLGSRPKERVFTHIGRQHFYRMGIMTTDA